MMFSPLYRNYKNPYKYSYNNATNTYSFIKEQQKNTKIFTEETITKDETSTIQSFEILGIRLYFDDILILALLFFLYLENVKDDFLFIILILVLIG